MIINNPGVCRYTSHGVAATSGVVFNSNKAENVTRVAANQPIEGPALGAGPRSPATSSFDDLLAFRSPDVSYGVVIAVPEREVLITHQ